jgi:hypothetical protein
MIEGLDNKLESHTKSIHLTLTHDILRATNWITVKLVTQIEITLMTSW